MLSSTYKKTTVESSARLAQSKMRQKSHLWNLIVLDVELHMHLIHELVRKPSFKLSYSRRHIEGEPIPDTPAGEVIQLQTFPYYKGSSSHYSSIPSESASDRRPDGAEEPDLPTSNLYGERRSSKTSMRKSSDTLSSHSKLQQIPERKPLISSARYPRTQSPPPYNNINPRQRPYEFKVISTLKCLVFCSLKLKSLGHQFRAIVVCLNRNLEIVHELEKPCSYFEALENPLTPRND